MKSSLRKCAFLLTLIGMTTVAQADYVTDLRVQCSAHVENLITRTIEPKEVEFVLKEVGSEEAGKGQLVGKIQGFTIQVSSPRNIVMPIMNLKVTTPSSQAVVARFLTEKENALIYQLTQSNIQLSVTCTGYPETRKQ